MAQDATANADGKYFSQLLGARSLSKQLRRRYWLGRVTHRSGLVLNTGSGLDCPDSKMERGRTVVSVDVSEWALHQSHGLRVCADLTALPFRDGVVGGVLALDVLEHLAHPSLALREVCRVLQYGGRVVISVPNAHSASARLADRTGDPTRWIARRDPTHVSLLSPATWRTYAERAGLVIESEGTDMPWAAPYGSRAIATQRMIARVLAISSSAIRPVLPWRVGENLLLLARRG